MAHGGKELHAKAHLPESDAKPCLVRMRRLFWDLAAGRESLAAAAAKPLRHFLYINYAAIPRGGHLTIKRTLPNLSPCPV